MVQGGYNVALAPGDSVERHFMDTIEGGKWLNDQDLAWLLVTGAQERIRELENELGCFFDRDEDGTIHQKAFAGQTFDRTVHKGDLTGIEIMGRLAEQVWARGLSRLEDHRAVELIPSKDGKAVSGVLMIDMCTGGFVFVRTKAVLLATGGGPTMYRYHTPSGDKTCDGMAMALRAGLALRDMEMVQFHPTGLLAGDETRMTGTVLEEGLRGYGAYLLDGGGERFMDRYDDRGERATRDIVSRAMFAEIRAGKVGPLGGLYLSMGHLDGAEIRRRFPGMVERCADCGFDLVSGRVEVVPTAHYMMGGVEFEADCKTAVPGLFAAGEDTGGVHGANRLGTNSLLDLVVFGRAASIKAAELIKPGAPLKPLAADSADYAIDRLDRLRNAKGGSKTSEIRSAMQRVMQDNAAVFRSSEILAEGVKKIDDIAGRLPDIQLSDRSMIWNTDLVEALELGTLMVCARATMHSATGGYQGRPRTLWRMIVGGTG